MLFIAQLAKSYCDVMGDMLFIAQLAKCLTSISKYFEDEACQKKFLRHTKCCNLPPMAKCKKIEDREQCREELA